MHSSISQDVWSFFSKLFFGGKAVPLGTCFPRDHISAIPFTKPPPLWPSPRPSWDAASCTIASFSSSIFFTDPPSVGLADASPCVLQSRHPHHVRPFEAKVLFSAFSPETPLFRGLLRCPGISHAVDGFFRGSSSSC